MFHDVLLSLFFRPQVIFNTSVLVQEEFLQKNYMPHLNEDVSYIM